TGGNFVQSKRTNPSTGSIDQSAQNILAIIIRSRPHEDSGPGRLQGTEDLSYFDRVVQEFGLTVNHQNKTVHRRGYSRHTTIERPLLWKLFLDLLTRGGQTGDLQRLQRDWEKFSANESPKRGTVYSAIDELKSFLNVVNLNLKNKPNCGWQLVNYSHQDQARAQARDQAQNQAWAQARSR
ncbi:MAG: hypothetical protein WCJ35_13515, partial [Planctomycetota bacterium]